MTAWDEIRDDVAGMLADGQPMEDVISNLEQRKNEMAKANLIEAIEQMKKPKPMTNDEWRRTCSTEEFAEFLFIIGEDNWLTDISNRDEIVPHEKDVVEWLKQPHRGE